MHNKEGILGNEKIYGFGPVCKHTASDGRVYIG